MTRSSRRADAALAGRVGHARWGRRPRLVQPRQPDQSRLDDHRHEGDPWSVAISDGTTDYPITESDRTTPPTRPTRCPAACRSICGSPPRPTTRCASRPADRRSPARPSRPGTRRHAHADRRPGQRGGLLGGRPEGGGHLSIGNPVPRREQLSLDTATSNDAWSVSLAADPGGRARRRHRRCAGHLRRATGRLGRHRGPHHRPCARRRGRPGHRLRGDHARP